MMQLRIHKLRAKAFTKYLKEEQNDLGREVLLAVKTDRSLLVLTARKTSLYQKFLIKLYITPDNFILIILQLLWACLN